MQCGCKTSIINNTMPANRKRNTQNKGAIDNMQCMLPVITEK